MPYNLCKSIGIFFFGSLWNLVYDKHHIYRTKEMTMLKYLFLFMAAFISGSAVAQRDITGVVTDEARMPISGALVKVKGTKTVTATNSKGYFKIAAPAHDVILAITAVGYADQQVRVKKDQKTVTVKMVAAVISEDLEVEAAGTAVVEAPPPPAQAMGISRKDMSASKSRVMNYAYAPQQPHNTEDYSPITENIFHNVKDQPLSTFSIDVDRASYANVRRYLNQGQLPPADAVRVEEMINYFDYQYKAPTGTDPVAIYADMATCPWDAGHQLVRVALKGRQVANEKLPPSNLTFLIDVSGSMWSDNKLPLAKQALKALVQQLRPADRVAIVVYAGAAGVVLPSTPGSEKTTILDALEKLQAGGSTAGGEGIKLAYSTAAANLLEDGNNRVILLTDGDFNVGASSDGELEQLITKERSKGIFLSVLGFGMGNYKDNKLEILADKGNGNYAYIDNYEEARRTFVTEFGGTLFTIAKDVKLQLEFNPAYVQSYRLIGYENRMLQNEDFNNDKKDAGEMGAGHTVTALYEIVPVGGKSVGSVDPLKYQQGTANPNYSGEALTVKLRYKAPKSETSQLMTQVLPWKINDLKKAPEDFRMATAVAAFGLLLRNSDHKGDATYEQVLSLARDARGTDQEGYRAEFIQMVKKASLLSNGNRAVTAIMPDDAQ
jgi:Ca-activated chloride channel family protein